MPRARFGAQVVFVGSQAVHVCASADGRSVRRPKETGIIVENMIATVGLVLPEDTNLLNKSVNSLFIFCKERQLDCSKSEFGGSHMALKGVYGANIAPDFCGGG